MSCELAFTVRVGRGLRSRGAGKGAALTELRGVRKLSGAQARWPAPGLRDSTEMIQGTFPRETPSRKQLPHSRWKFEARVTRDSIETCGR